MPPDSPGDGDDGESIDDMASDPREHDAVSAGDAGEADAGRDVDPEERDSGTDVDTEAAYDAEEPHAEWLLWLAAILIAIGAILLIAPPGMVPELVVGLAPILVIIGLVGWLGQWLYRRYR